MIIRLFQAALLAALAATASAVSVSELLQPVYESIDPSELEEPGNTRLAEAIAELVAEDLGLAPAERLDLRLALAEAWVGAGDSEQAEQALTAVLAEKGASPAQREQAGLAWVASWQARLAKAEKPAELPGPGVGLAAHGDLGRKVAARVHSAEAQRQLALKQVPEAIAQLDQAVALLKDAPVAERVPLYVLHLLALEQQGAKADEIQAWLAARSADPAVAQIMASALTNGQKLVGQQAPPMRARRLDGKAGEIDLAAFRGKPVLIDFFATWCRPCEAQATEVAAFAAAHAAAGLVTIGISLDTKDTVANLPGFIQKHGIAYAVVGDGLGWDSELDDAFHVEGIPHLVLIAPDGRVAAVDLVGKTSAETVANLGTAVRAYLAAPPGAAPSAPQEVIP